jgi:hypothetical protein
MPRKLPEAYIPEVFKTVGKMSDIVGSPLGLYRWHKKTYLQLSPNDITAYGIPAYPNPEGYGQFIVGPTDYHGKTMIPQPVTSFTITPFTGSCALCISTAAFVSGNYRNRGINKLGLALREAIAGATGYTGLICTDIASNLPSIRGIHGAGFKLLYTLKNKRTQNDINLYIKELE